MSDLQVPIRVERTNNRHSRAVYRNGAVVIRLAKRLSNTEEQTHITMLLKKMQRIVERERQRTTIDPFRLLLQGQEYSQLQLQSGQVITLRRIPAEKISIRIHASQWNIHCAPHCDERLLHRKMWNALIKVKKDAMRDAVERINAVTLGVNYTDVRLRFTSTQWGSCSSRGSITLNPALLFLPQELMEYVIVHELAHRVHPNHSQRFWATVLQVMPNALPHRRSLRRFRLPTLSKSDENATLDA